MNVTVAALLGLTLAQPPAPPPAQEYHPFAQRSIKFPISYAQDPKTIRKVELWFCRNGDQVWQKAAVAPPTQAEFRYTAPDDGRYWFHLVVEDLKGVKDPANLTAEPPAMKVLIDTRPPAVTFTGVKRNNDEVTVEWKVDDQYPKDEATRVYFRPASATEGWSEVSLPPTSRSGVRFPAGTPGPVVVRVVATDVVGNTGEGLKEVPGASAAAVTTTSMSPGTPAFTPPGPLNPPSVPAPPAPGVTTAPGVVPPPDVLAPPAGIVPPAGVVPPTSPAPPVVSLSPPGPMPSMPSAPPPSFTTTPAAPVAPVASNPPASSPAPLPTSPAAPAFAPPTPTPPAFAPPPSATVPPVVTTAPPAAPTNSGGPQPVATFDPRNNLVPASATGAGAGPVAQPGGYPPPPAAAAELARPQVIGTTRFDLNYQVEQKGPSGISRVDLWVTRDNGRTWVLWSQHDGREGPVKVNLATPVNPRPEGLYGFRIVPVSGAGLSETTPAAGDAPEIRAVVDLTAPAVLVYPAASDPAAPDCLVVKWEASDQNFGDDPITLEWADRPAGPWRSVTAPVGDGVVQAGVGVGGGAGGAVARRLPNTGSFSWRVPAGLPPRVYLKVSARDAAGNATELVTQEPVLVDLMKPRAKITGIGLAPVVARP